MACRTSVSQSIGPTNSQKQVEKPGYSGRAKERTEFLGYEFSVSEYRQACDNLAAFFAILRTWAEDEDEEEDKGKA